MFLSFVFYFMFNKTSSKSPLLSSLYIGVNRLCVSKICMVFFDGRKPAFTMFFHYQMSSTAPWEIQESGCDASTSETMWVLFMSPSHIS